MDLLKNKFAFLPLYSLLLVCLTANAQIPIQNGSFEGTPGGAQSLANWQSCSYCSGIMPHTSWIGLVNAVDGLTFYGMDYSPGQPFDCTDSVTQKLFCPVIAHKQNRFRIQVSSLYKGGLTGGYGNGVLRVYGSNSECITQQFLWESPITTNQWKEYQVEFIPDSAWQYIILKPGSIDGTRLGLGIDAMSDIYVDDYTFLKLQASTNTTDSNCYTLNAVTDMANISYGWNSEPALNFTNASTQQICITQDTRVTVTLQSPCGEYKDTGLLKYHATDNALVFPNAFTPNNDGHNDEFKAINSELNVTDYHLRIYNRWGQLIFETDKVTEGWNGGKHPAGTYFFACSYLNEMGEQKQEKGNVLLIY